MAALKDDYGWAGPFIGPALGALSMLIIWASRKFIRGQASLSIIQEEKTEEKFETRQDYRKRRESFGIDEALRAALAEFELKLRNTLIDPLRVEAAQMRVSIDRMSLQMDEVATFAAGAASREIRLAVLEKLVGVDCPVIPHGKGTHGRDRG